MGVLLPENISIKRSDGSYIRFDGVRIFRGGMNELFISLWKDVQDRAENPNDPLTGQYMYQVPDDIKSKWIDLSYETIDALFPGGEKVIDTDSVSLDSNELSLSAGEIAQLTATVSPDDAYIKDVTWSSSDDSIVTVSAGVVTAIAIGEATITVTTVDRGKTATCKVTVNNTEETK